MAAAAGLSNWPRKPVEDAIRCFANHAQFMRDDLYLAPAGLFASGVIEGAYEAPRRPSHAEPVHSLHSDRGDLPCFTMLRSTSAILRSRLPSGHRS
jgi:hypothetical protein